MEENEQAPGKDATVVIEGVETTLAEILQLKEEQDKEREGKQG